MRRAVRLIIEGRVQAVGYRLWATREAMRLGIDGWVRNLSDGTVELYAIGDDASLSALFEACRRGPTAALVTSISQGEAEDDGTQGFRERTTI
jgi:acylphosphatase